MTHRHILGGPAHEPHSVTRGVALVHVQGRRRHQHPGLVVVVHSHIKVRVRNIHPVPLEIGCVGSDRQVRDGNLNQRLRDVIVYGGDRYCLRDAIVSDLKDQLIWGDVDFGGGGGYVHVDLGVRLRVEVDGIRGPGSAFGYRYGGLGDDDVGRELRGLQPPSLLLLLVCGGLLVC